MNEDLNNIADCDTLPEGWTRAKLSDIARINMGQSPPGTTYNECGQGMPFFQGKADFGIRYPKVRIWCTKPLKIASPGDVLISVRAPVGPTNVADRMCVIGRGLAALSPLGSIPSEIMLFQLRLLEPVLLLSGTGSTFTAIQRQYLEDIDIVIPPLAEQKRIVAKVEELLPQVNSTKERLKRASQILKHFRQAVLSAACSGRLTEGWREKEKHDESLSQVLEQLRVQREKEFEESNKVARTMGQRPPQRPLNLEPGKVEELSTVELPEIPEEWVWVATRDVTVVSQYGSSIKADSKCQDGVPILRMGNIQDGKIDFSDLKYVRFAEELKAFVLEEGDFLFNRTNSPELVGKSAIFEPHTTTLFASYLIRLKFDKELSNPAYVCYWMNSPYGRAWAREVRTDGVSQSNINATKLLMMPLPLPPLPEQNEIIHRIKALFKLADAIEKRIGTASLRADKLAQSILAKAFRGELLPTEAELARQEGRSYEPASILLERVKAEREKKPSGPRQVS